LLKTLVSLRHGVFNANSGQAMRQYCLQFGHRPIAIIRQFRLYCDPEHGLLSALCRRTQLLMILVFIPHAGSVQRL
jgi:hypothetical protein